MMERIEDCISFLAGKASQTIYRTSRDALAPYGITPVQYAVMQVLWEADRRTGAEICSRLVLDSATITGVLDRLEKLELIERRPDAVDRRINRIHLTRKGKAQRDTLQGVMVLLNKRVVEHFGSDASRVWKILRELAVYQSDEFHDEGRNRRSRGSAGPAETERRGISHERRSGTRTRK